MMTGTCDKCVKGIHDQCRIIMTSTSLHDDSLAYCSCHCGDTALGALPNEWPKPSKKVRRELRKFPEFPDSKQL